MRRAIPFVLVAAFAVFGQRPTGTWHIEQMGLIACGASNCEPSAVELIGNRLLIANDATKEKDGKRFFSLEVPSVWPDVIDPHLLKFEEEDLVLSWAQKIEAMAADRDLVLASTDFSRIPYRNDPDDEHRYNMLMWWRGPKPSHVQVVTPSSSDGGKVTSVNLRDHLKRALKSKAFVDGPPHFKVEGLTLVPGSTLLLGIRESGQHFERRTFGFQVLAATYAFVNNQLVLNLPFRGVEGLEHIGHLLKFADDDAVGEVAQKARQEREESLRARFGLSSLLSWRERIWVVGTIESGEAQLGHRSYIFTAGWRDGRFEEVTPISGSDGLPLLIPCKLEGLTALSDSKLFGVCDEDRTRTFVFGKGAVMERKNSQGIYVVLSERK